jgi:hypothetical protein
MKALKKVPGENKGLSKLPSAVRNKMGYMKKGGKVYQGGGKVKKSTANTDELGREGHFNPYTKKTKGANSLRAGLTTQYPEKYQNEIVGKRSHDRPGYPEKVGSKEQRMRNKHKTDSVMSLRAEAYQNRKNKFGVEKPEAKVMKSGGKVVKYQEGGKYPTPTERTYTPDEIRITAARGNQPNADYKGYERIKTPKEVLEGTEAKRLRMALQNKFGPLRSESLGQLRKIAKTDGVYDDAVKLARGDYQKEMAKRR